MCGLFLTYTKGGDVVAKASSPYQRHLRRLTRQAHRMEERYYFFPPDFYEQLKAKNARQLSHLKTDWLYKQVKFEDIETGEIYLGEEGRKIERKRSAKKAAETRKRRKEGDSKDYAEYDDIIFQRFEEDFYNWLRLRTQQYLDGTDSRGKHKRSKRADEVVQAEERGKSMLAVLYEKAKTENPEMLARRIEESSDFIGDTIIRIQAIIYDAEVVNDAVSAIAEIIKGDSLTMLESIQVQMDAEGGEYEWQG